MRQLAGVLAIAFVAGGAIADPKPAPTKPAPAPAPAPGAKPAPAPAPKGDPARPAGEPAKSAGEPAQPAGDLVVGAYLPMTGAETTFGVSLSNGIGLAVEERNRAGGVRG